MALDVGKLADFARAHDLFDLAPPAETHASHKPLPAAVGDSLELADLALRFKTGGRADLGSLTFGALTAAAVVQLFRGQFLSPGVTLLHYALALIPQPVSYRELRPPV